MCSNQCQCFGFAGGLQPWVEHNKALLCVSLNKQEGIWCLLLLLANTALTVTATVITAISVVATNNTTLLAIGVHTITNAKIKHPGSACETVRKRKKGNYRYVWSWAVHNVLYIEPEAGILRRSSSIRNKNTNSVCKLCEFFISRCEQFGSDPRVKYFLLEDQTITIDKKRGIHSDALIIITKNKRHMIQMAHLTSHHQPIYRLWRWVEIQYVTL